MTDRESRSMRLIVNGAHCYDDTLRDAIHTLRTMGHSVETDVCEHEGDGTALAARAAKEGADAVVAVGGDGTLNEVVNGVYSVSKSFACAIGIVPHGTANDFATCYRIPTDDPFEALRIVAEGQTRLVDVGRVNGKLFANVATGGFGADIVRETPEVLKNLVGKLAYMITGVAGVKNLESRPTRVRGADFLWEGNMFSMNVGNGVQAGGGIRVCPRARLDDGLLDVLILPEMPLRNALSLYDDLRHNGVHLSELVVYHQSPWFEVEATGGIYLNLDGESHVGDAFRFDLLPRAMPIYLP